MSTLHTILASLAAIFVMASILRLSFILGRRSARQEVDEAIADHEAEEAKLKAAATPLLEALTQQVKDLERRWANAQDAVELFQEQRDDWRNRCSQQAMLHLTGQQQLETNIIATRTMLHRLVDAWNVERKERNEPPVDVKTLDLLAPPVGQAAKYFEDIKKLLLGAPAQFEAAIASRRVNEDGFDEALAAAIVRVRLADKRPATGLPPQHDHIVPKVEAHERVL